MDHTQTWRQHHDITTRAMVRQVPAVIVRCPGMADQVFIGPDDGLRRVEDAVHDLPGVTVKPTTVNVVR